MPWIKVDDKFPRNTKIRDVGERAGFLFVCSICFAGENLTDGFIAHKVVPSLYSGIRQPYRLADVLVRHKLWHRVDGGFQIHDYHDYQPTAAEVKARREFDRRRKRQKLPSDSARNPSGIPPDSTVSRARQLQSRPKDPDPEVVPDRHSVPSSGLEDRPRDGDGWTMDDLPDEAPDPFTERVGAFLEAYQELYREILGARYHVRPAHDAPAARRLCATWSDGRLRQMAELFLKTDEPWIRGTGRTLGVFESRASWCEARLAECGISEEAG